MALITLSEGRCSTSGLQMLLDRWKLQEKKLHVFEESLKEVNKLTINEPIQCNLSILQQTQFDLSDDVFGTSIDSDLFGTTSVRSITSSEDDFGLYVSKDNYEEEEEIDIPNNESMEEFEKRILKTVLKDEVLVNDNIVKGSYLDVPKATTTCSKNVVQKKNSGMLRLPANELLKNALQSIENVEGKEQLIQQKLFQQNFQEQPVSALHLALVSMVVLQHQLLEKTTKFSMYVSR